MTEKSKKSILLNTAFYSVAAIAFLLGLKLLAGPLLPFAVAATLAVSLSGVAERLHKKYRIKRSAAAVMLTVFCFLFVTISAVLLSRALCSELQSLAAELPSRSESIEEAFRNVSRTLSRFFGRMPDFGGLLTDISSAALTSAAGKGAELLTELAGSFVSAIPQFLISVIVTVVAGIYFSKDYVKLTETVKKLLPDSAVAVLKAFKASTLKKTACLLSGYAVIALMTFAELLIGFLILRVPYAPIIAAATALIDILPVLGSGTVLIPWALFCALGGSTATAIGLFVLYAIITVIRNFSEPKIIGSKLGMHPLVSLAAVVLGIKIYGAVGVLLAPIAVIILKSVYEMKNKNPETR